MMSSMAPAPWSSSKAATAQSSPSPVLLWSQSSLSLQWPKQQPHHFVPMPWGHQGRCPSSMSSMSSAVILPWLGLVAPDSLQPQERTQPGTCHPAQRGRTPCRARGPPGCPCCYLQRPAPFQVYPESTPLSTVHPAWLHVASMPPSAACCGPQGLVTSIQGHPRHGLMLCHCHCHSSPCAMPALVWR